MSRNRIRFDGMEEFREALKKLPALLRAEAQGIVVGAAERAKAELIAAYPKRTGNLKRGVTSRTEFRNVGLTVIVTSQAKHAWLFENGSQARHSSLGAFRGSMPARPTFVPIMARNRRAMTEGLIALLARRGLTVVGAA